MNLDIKGALRVLISSRGLLLDCGGASWCFLGLSPVPLPASVPLQRLAQSCCTDTDNIY